MLPPLELRQHIAEAVHLAIVAHHGDRSTRGCHLYAHIGSAITTILTGERYTVVRGRIALRGSGYTIRSDHSWFVRDHGADRVELVDFAARHWGSLAEGAPEPLPIDVPFFWGWSSDLPPGVTLMGDDDV